MTESYSLRVMARAESLRDVTLRYDEQSRRAVISFPPAENEDQERSGYGFTPDDAGLFIDGLTAIQARMACGASSGVSVD